jgi:hypothetical protein
MNANAGPFSRTRLWLLLAVLLAAAVIISVWSGRSQQDAATTHDSSMAAADHLLPQDADSRLATQAGAHAPVADSPLAGKAEGTLHVATAGGRVIELHVAQAAGVWQPERSRLRIGLTAEQLDHLRAVHLADALANDSFVAPDGTSIAMLEFVFMPTAQGFTQDELERATLTVPDGAGRMVEVDVLSSLQWPGSLPSPRLGAGAYRPTQIDMKLSGAGYLPGGAEPAHNWNLSLSAPVGLR